MKLLKLSLVLVMIAVAWSPSTASLLANESPNREPKSKTTSVPSANKQQSEADKKATPTEHPPNTTAPEPIPVVKEPTPAVKENGSKKQADYLCAIKTWLTRIQAGSIPDYLLVFITGAAVWVALGTLRAINRQVSANQTSAEAALEEARAIKMSERAYIKMSHDEDGLVITQNETVRMCDVNLKIENCGRTPGTVTDVRLNISLLGGDKVLPKIPNYGGVPDESTPNVFLVPGDFFYWFRVRSLGKLDSPNPATGAIRLYVLGYVDYIDIFGQRHRAGYARQYNPHVGGGKKNLFFVSEPGYNYDRQRQPGEGNDWD